MLSMKTDVTLLGESRTLAVRRFKAFELSLRAKSLFDEFTVALLEYYEMGQAEPVHISELKRPCNQVYYLLMHAVQKESSTTSKVHVVFHASAKSWAGTSLNDQLLVRFTVHSSLVDVLLWFGHHKVALTSYISRMYRAVLLPKTQCDLRRFVWSEDSEQPLVDYRMTRLTFGVSASWFAANMVMKQNALENVDTHPQAVQAVLYSFYIDHELTGANSLEEAVQLCKELQELFALEGFVLKLKSSESSIAEHIPSHLLDKKTSQEITCTYAFT